MAKKLEDSLTEEEKKINQSRYRPGVAQRITGS
jgi:hypothetical protein